MIFQLDGIELNTEQFSMTREGRVIAVEPKVFDLMVFLIRNRDRLVTRNQLFDELWPGRVVSDNVLSNDVKLARAALGDDGTRQKFIRTVRGRGYQFVGDVVEIDADVTRQPSTDTTSKIASTRDQPSQLGTLKPNSIAVLPFENRSSLDEDAFFADGFHDELINQISRIGDLATISRTSVMAYRVSSKSIREIGEELSAANIIEGSVQRAGNQIRIGVQLIDAKKDEHIWVEAYTRELSAENIFAIQSEIALAVADQLKAVLSPQQRRDITKTPTQNMAALEAYFHGRASSILATTQGHSAAIEHFRRAIDIDPDFAEAHAQLGMALLEKIHIGGLPFKQQVELAEPFIERALELNPELSEAYEALAFLDIFRGDQPASEVAYEQAIKLNPNNASAHRAFGFFMSWQRAKPHRAYELLSRARLLDPQNQYTLALFGQVLMELERFEESRSVLLDAIDSGPNVAAAYQFIGYLYSWKLYRHDEAIKAYRMVYFLDPDVPWYALNLALAYYELGVPDRAIFFYERYLKISQDEAFDFLARLNLCALRGDREQEKRFVEDFKATWSGREPWGRDPWVDILLSELDAQNGHPELAVERFETVYPQLTVPGADINASDNMFKLAIAYTTSLYLCGDTDKAAPLADEILEILPTKSRYRWRGIGTMDAWLHLAMGDESKAMEALTDWRDLGGCLDLRQSRVFPKTLFDSPGFHALNNEILEDLAGQRVNLARMEAEGELASIPE